jgi:hypothetical protein
MAHLHGRVGRFRETLFKVAEKITVKITVPVKGHSLVHEQEFELHLRIMHKEYNYSAFFENIVLLVS